MSVSSAAPHSNESLTDTLAAATRRTPLDVPAQPLRGAAAHLYDPRRRRRVSRVLAAGEWDVMLVNLPSAELGTTPLWVQRPERPPALGLLHIAGSFRELGFRFGGVRERLAGRLVRRAEGVCVLSDSAARTFARVWGGGSGAAARVVRLPRPEVTPLGKEEARAGLGLPPAPALIGIAGRIGFKQKGQDTFARAAALLLEREPQLHFAVAGDGQDRERLRQLVEELGVAERFHLLGQVEDIGAFLSAIDAFAIPSRFEGLPLVALEALAAGVPGIASDIDGLRDVWPASWLVPAGDPGALAAALADLLAAPEGERERLLAAGRRAAEARTTDDVAAEFEPLLGELAA
jgi:glycosyltransferase involved in cell wall biosynthesis